MIPFFLIWIGVGNISYINTNFLLEMKKLDRCQYISFFSFLQYHSQATKRLSWSCRSSLYSHTQPKSTPEQYIQYIQYIHEAQMNQMFHLYSWKSAFYFSNFLVILDWQMKKEMSWKSKWKVFKRVIICYSVSLWNNYRNHKPQKI